jgi:L-serine/L-threonine ammonia-lyase
MMSKAIKSHGPEKPIRFYCSSGGNAGLACITAANTLGRPATVVVSNATSADMVAKLKNLGADVVQIGAGWREADEYLRGELLAKDANGFYVPPFDHEDIWEGHGTLVDELEVQMGSRGYDAIIASVGGGGLLAGIMDGLERHGRLADTAYKRPVKVMATETKGADSLSYSLKNNKLSRLDCISSIATCLGASQVAEKAFEWGLRPEVTSCVFSDAEAAMASVCFADDEKMLVEISCGVSIVPAYNGSLSSILYPQLSDEEFAKLNIVIVICGGSGISLQLLENYRQKYAEDEMVKRFHLRKLAGLGVRME